VREDARANVELHAREARVYDLLHPEILPPWRRRGLRALLGRIRRACGGEAIELGCGTGRLTALLVGEGFRVTAVDCSREMLGELERKHIGAKTVCADAREYLAGCRTCFDAVFSSSFLHHLADPLELLRLARTRLRPQGLYLALHEPAPRSALASLAERLEGRVFALGLALRGGGAPELDYSSADLWTSNGLRLPRLFRRAGMQVVRARVVGEYKGRLLSSLGPANSWELLARRPPSA